MKQRRRRKCLNCQQLFRPDPRVRDRQRYCSAPACRQASKAASQRHWREKPENADYFRGPEQVARVRDWRARHPGYWRRGATNRGALQDETLTQVVDKKQQSGTLVPPPLQELLSSQDLVLLGLIAHLTDSTLQDQLVISTLRLHKLATDVLTQGVHDAKTPDLSATAPGGTDAVQLDRSPAGPRPPP